MAEYSATCPACGGVLHANSELRMIKTVAEHAKKEHDIDLSVDKINEMIKKEKQCYKCVDEGAAWHSPCCLARI